MTRPSDEELMRQAITAAATVRRSTAPNPWVGAALLLKDGTVVLGATEPPGKRHAEIVALEAAAPGHVKGATLATTLEPCCTEGRTGACTDAIIEAGIARVIVAVVDPDAKVAGRGIAALRAAGIEVEMGPLAHEVAQQLRPYLHHRSTGRPEVTLKLAATLDGRTAAPDGSSKWITGEAARADAHELRADAQMVIVGAGTVRADDPELTVRLSGYEGPQPQRLVLGDIPQGAKVLPARLYQGPLGDLLDTLGAEGILSVLVEGGATVASQFHHQGLVDRYVVYLAPAIMGGSDGRGLFEGPGAASMAELWRGDVTSCCMVGEDLRVEVVRK